VEHQGSEQKLTQAEIGARTAGWDEIPEADLSTLRALRVGPAGARSVGGLLRLSSAKAAGDWRIKRAGRDPMV
jgi:hypothetical protein